METNAPRLGQCPSDSGGQAHLAVELGPRPELETVAHFKGVPVAVREVPEAFRVGGERRRAGARERHGQRPGGQFAANDGSAEAQQPWGQPCSAMMV